MGVAPDSRASIALPSAALPFCSCTGEASRRANHEHLLQVSSVSEDLEIEPGVTVGDWLMRELSTSYYLEVEPWATERAARVVQQLDPHRCGGRGGRPMEVVIPWITPLLAFTAPGRFIFVERRLYGPERECQADEYALDLCVSAGYDPQRCLAFFRIMENHALDCGDSAMVFGPDEQSDAELAPDAPWLTKARIWAWQRTYGYLPLRDRRARLQQHLESRSAADAGRSLPPEVPPRSRRPGRHRRAGREAP